MVSLKEEGSLLQVAEQGNKEDAQHLAMLSRQSNKSGKDSEENQTVAEQWSKKDESLRQSFIE